MKPILLGENMLYDLAKILASQLTSFVCGRRLSTIYAQHPVSAHDYRRHAELQRTLRSLCPDWRHQVIAFMRRMIRDERRATGGAPDFQTWLGQVQALDAENGHTTAYTPHAPGLFVKITSVTAEEAFHRSHQAESALLRPLQERARGTHPPAATPAPHDAMELPTAHASTVPPSCQPGTGADMPTTSAPESCPPATHPCAPIAGTLHSPCHDTTPHAHGAQPEADHLECGRADSAPAEPPQSRGEEPTKIHSSAQPTCPDTHAASGF